MDATSDWNTIMECDVWTARWARLGIVAAVVFFVAPFSLSAQEVVGSTDDPVLTAVESGVCSRAG